MNGNYKCRINSPELVDRSGLGLFNNDDSDSIIMRVLKNFAYGVFIWFYNIYLYLLLFVKKQYRTVTFFV